MGMAVAYTVNKSLGCGDGVQVEWARDSSLVQFRLDLHSHRLVTVLYATLVQPE